MKRHESQMLQVRGSGAMAALMMDGLAVLM